MGDDEVAYVKDQLGFDPSQKFHVPEKVYDYFAGCKEKGAKAEHEWNENMQMYASKYPDEWDQLQSRLSGKFAPDGWQDLLPSKDKLPQAAQPTRKSSGLAVQALVPKYNSFIAGSADLLESTFVNFDGQVEFQNVSRADSLTRDWTSMLTRISSVPQPASGLGNYSGRQIRYGIREFAMVGLGNGMAAYHKGTFIP